MPGQAGGMIRLEHNVGRGVVRVGVHGVGSCKRLRRRETNVVGDSAQNASVHAALVSKQRSDVCQYHKSIYGLSWFRMPLLATYDPTFTDTATEDTIGSMAARDDGKRALSVTEEAIEEIRVLITSGAWGPGTRLPREADLAAQLGLSRSSLREAVRALSLVRVLEVRQGDGTYVSSLEPDLLLGETARFATPLLRGRTVLELYEVRRLLEPGAAALATQRIDEQQKQSLKRELDRMFEAGDRGEDLVEADAAFHDVIARAAADALLRSLIPGPSPPTVPA